MIYQIKEINLAVANVCNASCIYCPRDSFIHEQKFMDVETVERIIGEATTPAFREVHPVVHSVLSENGEPFLHPQILDILRIVRAAGFGITLFSNFSLLRPAIAEIIHREKLIDAIHVNIDGAESETYRAVKSLSLHVVEANILDFIRIREEMRSGIRIFAHVISHSTYTQAVKKRFGVQPMKVNGREYLQDGPETVEKWQKILTPGMDHIGEDGVFFWAERNNGRPIAGDFGCPNLDRVKHVAYINPSGDWYACCFDSGNQLVVGNVLESSVLDVSKSVKRNLLIAKLEARMFPELGFPCTRVDACNGMARAEVQ